jgi:cobalamin biosynthesis protein CbiD
VVEDKLKKMAAAGRELRAGVGAAAAAAAAAAALLLAW